MTRLRYPGIILTDVKKSDNPKNFPILLPHLSVERRIEKYFEFCRAFDKREDPILRDNFQQHSHRLHWQEHPFVDAIRTVNSFRDRVWLTLVFSFTNEHWQTFQALLNGGETGLRKWIATGTRVSRHDLFQIYYPKGTNVSEWMITETKVAANDTWRTIRGKKGRWGVMNLAHLMADYFRERQGFSSALYPCKNFARYFAMGFPETVDPLSWIHPGTGSFRGLHQIFGGHFLMPKVRYTVSDRGEYVALNAAGLELKRQFAVLCDHPKSPIHEYAQLNHEDKACFFAKRIMAEAGVQKATHAIPYTWIFPADWDLRTGRYTRDPNNDPYTI